MKYFPVLVLVLALAVGAPPSLAQEAGDTEAIYARLLDLRLDAAQIHRVRDLTIRRDAISLSFRRGVIAFLEPVAGQVTGAVFLGGGEVLANPRDDIERRQLFKFTGSPILNEPFDAAILRFTDDTYAEILRLMEDRAREDVRVDDLEAVLPLEQNLGENSRLLNFRILKDLLSAQDATYFFAALHGERRGWFDVTYDERGSEEIVIGSIERGPTPELPDIWASFNRRNAGETPAAGPVVDVERYDLDVSVAADSSVAVAASVRVVPRLAGERVLDFDLTRTLRLTAVRVDGQAVPFFQHPVTSGQIPFRSLDTFILVLPEPTRAGEPMTLELQYAGQVFESRGSGIYFVSERSLWYPNAGLHDAASFEMTFHYPLHHVLVATGRQVEERVEDGRRHARWSSDGEYFFAGFNYGDFRVETDYDPALPIYVYLNNDVEAVYKEFEAQRALVQEMAMRSIVELSPRGRMGWLDRVFVPPDYEVFSTRNLGSEILGTVRSTLDFYIDRFGPYRFSRLSVSQFPVPFSQGWPSLLYVSTVSFFNREQRERLGIQDAEYTTGAEFVRAHEIAHQWFGNKVGWQSYRDQWFTEGLANYAGAMYLEDRYPQQNPLSVILAELAARLLAPTGPGTTHDDNGPIWLGQRLATSIAPSGYVDTIYTKSTWVVHMLRMLMREPESGSDARFLAMLRAFLEEHEGRPATTMDFKATVERHMNARMDVDGAGTMDWFFDQWVFGVGVPAYRMEHRIEERNGGLVAVGEVRQEGVTGFVMPVPVYARSSAGRLEYLGDVVVSDRGGRFEFPLAARPAGILLDPHRDILRRN